MAEFSVDKERLSQVADLVAEQHQVIVEELNLRKAGRRLLVQVVVDSESAIDLDAVASVSRNLDRQLEELELFGEQAFTLEVTTRGTDKPLTLPRHFVRNIGRLAKFQLTDGSEFEGRIETVAEAAVTASGREIALSQITEAIVVLEFNRKVEAAFDVVGEEDGE